MIQAAKSTKREDAKTMRKKAAKSPRGGGAAAYQFKQKPLNPFLGESWQLKLNADHSASGALVFFVFVF